MSTYDTDPYANQSTGSGDMKERAVEAVAEVDAGAKHVAGVAGEEAKGVAEDAKRAARGFFNETRTQLSDQASTQQHRAASALRSTSEELDGLASGTATGSNGVATSAVRAVGEQTRRVADWLEQREPADVVYEVRTFARRHTGAFLAIAAGVGVLAGRLTRALVSDARSGNGGAVATRQTYASGVPVGTTAGLGGTAVGGDAVGTGVYGGDTPIGDALADDTLAVGTEPIGMRGSGAYEGDTMSDEWTATGEARR